MHPSFALWVATVVLPPQDTVPTVPHLGPRPAQAAPFELPLPSELPQPVADDVLLTVAPATPWGDVDAAIRRLAAGGAKVVHFAASLPDGTAGAVGLALPVEPDVPVALVVRAHRDRAGVPADSLRVVLQRLLADFEPARAGSLPFAVEVPANARFEQSLRLLVACVDAGATRVVMRAGPAAGKVDERGALALDVDGPVRLQVVAQNSPPARPTQVATPFGALLPPPNVAPEPQLDGGAGGRYGGRGAGNRALAGGVGEALDRSLAWLGQQIAADGACRAEGASSVEATALVTLAFLGRGDNLVAGTYRASLQRTVGFLVASQRADGTFGEGADATPRAQALACWALAEAYGLSSSLPARCLRSPLADGLQRLWQLRRTDGGFGPGEHGDAITTAQVAIAMTSAAFFKLPTPADPKELLPWFEAHPPQAATAQAAVAFARCFVRQEAIPGAAALQWAGSWQIADAEGTYWIGHALFQAGGKPFVAFGEKCEAELLGKQVRDGADAGTFAIASPLPRLVATAWWTLALENRMRFTRLVR